MMDEGMRVEEIPVEEEEEGDQVVVEVIRDEDGEEEGKFFYCLRIIILGKLGRTRLIKYMCSILSAVTEAAGVVEAEEVAEEIITREEVVEIITRWEESQILLKAAFKLV